MKKLYLLVIPALLLFTFACNSGASSVSPTDADRNLKTYVEEVMQARGLNLTIGVERLKILDSPQGFYFYKISYTDPAMGGVNSEYILFDGKYLATDFIDTATGGSMSRDLQFEVVTFDIDTTNLSLIHGNRDAENVIIKITDFECPYCRMANAYLEEKIKGMDNVAVYIAHYPLPIHPNAELDARVFEAGLIMGQNFAHELFSNDALLNMGEEDIVQYFSKYVSDVARFRELIYSDEVDAKLAEGLKIANETAVTSTPIIFINGHKIEGFDQNTMDRVINSF